MGFNIFLYSDDSDANNLCRHFIDRLFYNFVNSGEMYGDESILIQSGKYYEVDLLPLLKLVYTNDEVTEDYIKANTQQTDFLLVLVETFYDKIILDKSVCDKIKYKAYETRLEFSEEQKQQLIKSLGNEVANSMFESFEVQNNEMQQNPNPWKSYFESGKILVDLKNLIEALKCFKNNGVSQLYLAAG